MKRLMKLGAVVAALAGAQTIAAGPAAAGGYYYCNPHGYHYAYYYSAGACCPRFYRTVNLYRPVVRYRRPCCW
jgi:hypothetical protein